MDLESRVHSSDAMVWKLAPYIDVELLPLLGQPDGFNVSGTLSDVDVAYYPKIGLRTSRARIGLFLDRDPSFFVTSFVQPLSLTMCMTILAIAALPISQIVPRNVAATGGMSTTVSCASTETNPQAALLTSPP